MKKLLLLALAIWTLAVAQWSQLPFFSTPIPDSDTALYWFLAKIIKEKGLFFGDFPIFFSVYYAFLYYLFSTIGNPVKVAIVFNGILYIASVYLFISLLKELFGQHVAKIGGVLFILTKVILFYALLPIKTMLVITLFLLFLLLTIKKKNLYAGITGGLLFNIEGIFLPLFLIYLSYFSLKKRIKAGIALLAGFILALTPATVITFKKTNQLILSHSTSGIHFYIGNWQRANGFYRRLHGVRPNAFGHYYDAKRLAERETGKKLTDKEVNTFWWKKGIKEVLKDPLKFIILLFKKLLIFFNNYEVPNNYNLYLIGKSVWILGLLPIDFAIALVLGLGGFTIARSKKINNELLDLTLILYPLILSLFFITSRYRVIYYIPLLSYGAVFINQLFEPKCQPWLLKKAVIVAAIALSISCFPIAEEVRSGYARVFKFKTSATQELKVALEKEDIKLVKSIFLRAKEYEIAKNAKILVK